MIERPSTYRHESCEAQIIFRDFDGNPTGQVGDKETFIKVDDLWYPERTIKAGAIGYRLDQMQLAHDYSDSSPSLSEYAAQADINE
jgi:hypothetical protein